MYMRQLNCITMYTVKKLKNNIKLLKLYYNNICKQREPTFIGYISQ